MDVRVVGDEDEAMRVIEEWKKSGRPKNSLPHSSAKRR